MNSIKAYVESENSKNEYTQLLIEKLEFMLSIRMEMIAELESVNEIVQSTLEELEENGIKI